MDEQPVLLEEVVRLELMDPCGERTKPLPPPMSDAGAAARPYEAVATWSGARVAI